MTTDDISPVPDEGAAAREGSMSRARSMSGRWRDPVDSLASRIVDEDIDISDVPEELRQRVIARSVQFAELRRRLLETGATMRLDGRILETSIARAYESVGLAESRRRVVPSRRQTSLAVAASILAALAVTTVVLRQSGSRDDVLVSDVPTSSAAQSGVSVADGSTAEAFAADVPGEVDSTAQQDSLVAPSAAGSAEQPQRGDLSGEYSSIQELEAAADVVARGGIAPSDKSLAGAAACASLTSSHLRVVDASYQGRPVQIHFLAKGDFIVYDSLDCTVVLSRDEGQSVIEPAR